MELPRSENVRYTGGGGFGAAFDAREKGNERPGGGPSLKMQRFTGAVKNSSWPRERAWKIHQKHGTVLAYAAVTTTETIPEHRAGARGRYYHQDETGVGSCASLFVLW